MAAALDEHEATGGPNGRRVVRRRKRVLGRFPARQSRVTFDTLGPELRGRGAPPYDATVAALQLLVTFEFPDEENAGAASETGSAAGTLAPNEGARPAAAARRAAHARSLAREVYDTAIAWAQWLELGAPLEEPGARGELEAPPVVRAAAAAAVVRAYAAHLATLPAGWADNTVIAERCRSELRAAGNRAAKMTLNGWKGWRRRHAQRARAAGEQLPAHVLAWLDASG